MKTVYLLTAGGTIDKSFSEQSGKVENAHSKIRLYLDQLRLPFTKVEICPVLAKDSLDFTAEDRERLVGAIRERLSADWPFVVTHGTDTVLETARTLEHSFPKPRVPLILTGAMIPLGFEHSDGLQNLTESLLAAFLLPPGVHLVMHNTVFNFRNVRKDRERSTFVPM